MGDKNGASEGGPIGNKSKPDPTCQAWFVAAILLAEEIAIKGRREVRGSTSGGKGRTTPLRGGRF